MATAGPSKPKPPVQIFEVKDILDPFNEQLNLSEAYNWQRDDVSCPPLTSAYLVAEKQDQIYGWLQIVVENKDDVFGLAENTWNDLKKIQQELRDLSLLDGKDYIAPELEPDQHILREKNNEWPPPAGSPEPRWDNACKLKVRGHDHNNYLYSSPYDLLGLFLSTVGPAPVGATKANFYLPLTAVYCWWCTQIAGERVVDPGTEKAIPLGTGWIPAMIQCTWRQKEGQLDQFFLGCSSAGYPKGKPKDDQMTAEELVAYNKEVEKWELAVKYGRYKVIEDSVVQLKFNFEDSPSIRKSRDLGTRYGNCAETFPFVQLLMRNSTDADGECHGFALKRALISATAANYKKVITKTSYKRYLVDPCENCEALIQLFHQNSEDFVALEGLYSP